VPVFIRLAQELGQILAHNPFLKDKTVDQSKLHVSFLYQAAPEPAWARLPLPEGIPDRFARGEQEIYIYCPNGYARSKLPASFFEKALGVPVTNRNWNTVNALYRIALQN